MWQTSQKELEKYYQGQVHVCICWSVQMGWVAPSCAAVSAAAALRKGNEKGKGKWSIGKALILGAGKNLRRWLCDLSRIFSSLVDQSKSNPWGSSQWKILKGSKAFYKPIVFQFGQRPKVHALFSLGCQLALLSAVQTSSYIYAEVANIILHTK